MLWTAGAAGFALHVHTVPWAQHSSCLQHRLQTQGRGRQWVGLLWGWGSHSGCFSFWVQEPFHPVSHLFAAAKLVDDVSFFHISTTFSFVTLSAPAEIYRLVFSSSWNCSYAGRSTLPFLLNSLFSDSNFSLFSAVFLWSFSCLLLFPSLFSFQYCCRHVCWMLWENTIKMVMHWRTIRLIWPFSPAHVTSFFHSCFYHKSIYFAQSNSVNECGPQDVVSRLNSSWYSWQ